MTRVPGVPRKPGGGFKKKIAKLEAENGELKQALAESEKRCAILESRFVIGTRIQIDSLKDENFQASFRDRFPDFNFESFCAHLASEVRAVEAGGINYFPQNTFSLSNAEE